MRIALHRFVLVIDVARRKEDEEKNQRHHDVVVQAAPLIRPQNVSANCAPYCAHGRGGFRRRGCFRPLPVYWGIHAMAILRGVALTPSSRQCGPCPCKAAARQECARCRPPADNFRRWPPRCALPPDRCRSECATAPSCSSLQDGTGCWRGALENFRSSSRMKSRETVLGPAATLRCHMSSRKKILYRTSTA